MVGTHNPHKNPAEKLGFLFIYGLEQAVTFHFLIFVQFGAVFCANLGFSFDFAQFRGVFCANFRWWVDFAQFWGNFCAILNFDGTKQAE